MGNIDLKSFERTLGELISRAVNLQKPLTEIGVMMVSEMKENIRVQGRPEQWEQSQRAKREGGQTLRDTGTLMTGIIAEVGETSVGAGPTMMGKNHVTDPRAMALLAYGGDVRRLRHTSGVNAGKFKKGKIGKKKTGVTVSHYPKRDFTYISPESGQTFGQIIQNFLVQGK